MKFGGVNLRLALVQKLGTYWDAHHEVGLRELWSWFARYVYLPRLRDVSVLEGAVRDGAGNILWRSETFAYAAAREEPAEYRGLVAGRVADTPITSTSLIVDGSVLPDPLAGPETKPSTGAGSTSGPEPGPGPGRCRRRASHGSAAKPCSWTTALRSRSSRSWSKRSFGPLATQPDVTLTVRVEIDAQPRGCRRLLRSDNPDRLRERQDAPPAKVRLREGLTEIRPATVCPPWFRRPARSEPFRMISPGWHFPAALWCDFTCSQAADSTERT